MSDVAKGKILVPNGQVGERETYVENHYRVIPDKAHRAVSGLSMGGAHTLAVTAAYPDVFDYICPMGCGGRKTDEFIDGILGIKKAGYKLYWHAAGTADFAHPGAVILDEILTENGMEHSFYEKNGGHTWSNLTVPDFG
jgi:enterochelin esterase family protein